jgi:hypothetical protein
MCGKRRTLIALVGRCRMKECMRGFVARGEPPTPRAPARMAHASTSSPQPSRRGSRVSSTDDASLLADPNLGARIRAGQLPVEVAVQLLRSDDPIVAMAAADHPDLPQRAIDDVAASEDPVRRCVAATSSRASSETLRRLSEDADGRVRETVATNTGTPPDALSVLWQDPRLRSALLANHALPRTCCRMWRVTTSLTPCSWATSAGAPRPAWACRTLQGSNG